MRDGAEKVDKRVGLLSKLEGVIVLEGNEPSELEHKKKTQFRS